jgi:arylsulfatase A-like enzyme
MMGRLDRIVLALVVGVAALLGCTPDPGPLDRLLELRPPGEEQELPGNVVYRLADEPQRWSHVAPGMEVIDAEGDIPAHIVFGAGKEEQDLRVTRNGPMDMVGARLLRVTASFDGRGELRASLLRKGVVVGRAAAREIKPSEEPVPIDLVLYEKARNLDEIDGLRLACFGGKRRLGLVSVELVSEYDLTELPQPTDFVRVGDTWREGTTLVSGAPLVAEVTPGPETELTFSAALPVRLARADGAPDDILMVSVHDGEERLDARWVSIDTGPRDERTWRDVRWGLGRFAGRDLTITFEMRPTARGTPAACVLTGTRVSRPREGAPLVLMVTSDTHRADHLGAGGAEWLQTPHLDALAARGTLFLDAISPTNVTGPAHQALLTGVHPRDLPPIKNAVYLDEVVPTLAEKYRAAGYRTLAVVSAKHLGHSFSGLGRGFDKLSRPDGGQREAVDSIALMQDWLDDEDGRPVFAWLHLFDAHAPYFPPEGYDRYYYDDDQDPFAADHGHPGPLPPDDMPGLQDMSFARAQYAAEITGLDALLAPLLDRPRVADGLVAFVADHGEGLGEGHVHFGHAELYPETFAVPLMLAGPGVPPGQTVEGPVTSLDLGRTLLDLSGLGEVPFDGRSLLHGGSVSSGPRFIVSSGGHSAAVMDGRWLLVLQLRTHQGPRTVRSYDLHTVELYDRVADPRCLTDLFEQEPERTRKLRQGLVAWLQRAHTEGEGRALEDDDTAALLTELGYAGMTEMEAGGLWVPDDCEHCQRWGGDS